MEEAMYQTLASLDSTMHSLKNSYNATNLVSMVPPYHGNSDTCRLWLSNVLKFCEINNEQSDGRRVQIAYATARGPVSDFIKRWTDNKNLNQEVVTWDALKADLISHFSAVSDSDHAHDVLKKIKQGPSETVSFYAERIHRLAKEAYTVNDLTDAGSRALAQKQLVSYFLDGLRDVGIKLKLLRKNPTTLDAALNIAREECALMQRFELRNPRAAPRTSPRLQHPDEEPMEVDHVRPRRRDFSHPARRDSRPLYDPRRVQTRYSPQFRRSEVHAVEQDNRCHFCNAPGHFRRDCPKIQAKGNNSTQKSSQFRGGNQYVRGDQVRGDNSARGSYRQPHHAEVSETRDPGGGQKEQC